MWQYKGSLRLRRWQLGVRIRHDVNSILVAFLCSTDSFCNISNGNCQAYVASYVMQPGVYADTSRSKATLSVGRCGTVSRTCVSRTKAVSSKSC